MDSVFSRVAGGRFKNCITDSILMWILHCAMNKAHERVQSKKGVIERLNEISKFYELALMQLDGCLKFVQEEADSGLESSDEEVLGELAEIRDRLERRLKESELAISEKDRELNEKFENEIKLRQLLEAKEREVHSLHADLKIERTKSADEDIHDEYEVIDDKTSGGSSADDMNIEQMRLDIDTLKETMDIAFQKMQTAIFFSGLDPIEQQWKLTIEKDAIANSIKGFMQDIQESFRAEIKRRANYVSSNLSVHLSDMMNEMGFLYEELVRSSTTAQTNIESKIPPKETSSSSEEMNELNASDNGEHYVAKMIKNHESIIRRKNEELNWLKLETVRDKGYLNSSKEKDPQQRIRDMAVQLESLMNWNDKLGETFGDENEGTSLNRKLSTAESLMDTFEDVWEKVTKVSASRSFKSELENEIQKLKDEKEDASLRALIVEQVFLTLLEGSTNDLCNMSIGNRNCEDKNLEAEMYRIVVGEVIKDVVDSANCQPEAISNIVSFECIECPLKEDIYTILLREIAKEWRNEIDSIYFEAILREEIYLVIIAEALNPNIDSLANVSELNAEPELVRWKKKEPNKVQISQKLLTEIDCLSVSVSSKIGEALADLAFTNAIVTNLRSDSGIEGVEDAEVFKYEAAKMISPDFVYSPIAELSKGIVDFSAGVEGKCKYYVLRLEQATQHLIMATGLIKLLRERECLYNKAFVSRCESLWKAETEVDLLADQVDKLLNILDMTHKILYQYSPVLQQYFEVLELMKLIENELARVH